MKRKNAFGALLMIGVMGFFPWHSTAQDATLGPPQSRGTEIHDACTRAGVVVRSVSQKADGTYVVHCDPADHAKAMGIMRGVLATPAPGKTPVTTLQDALVVLRFEPQNTAAQALVRNRYDELRKKHLDSLKRKKK